MKKMMVFFLAFVFMISFGKTSVSASSDAGNLAEEICRKAGWNMSSVYREDPNASFAFAFGISSKEFNARVENAVCLRETVDSKGRAIYIFEAEEANDALWLGQKIYDSYEFAPCDVAEKMMIAVSGKYVMLFKSDALEAENAVQSFRSVMGGTLRFKKERSNHA